MDTTVKSILTSPELDLPARLLKQTRNSVPPENDDKSTDTVSFRGVSLDFIKDFCEKFLKYDIAPDAELLRLKADYGGFLAEITGRVVKFENNVYELFVPFSPTVLKVPMNYVDLVPREEWSTEEVVQHVIIPMTLKNEQAVVDSFGKKFAGKPFQGYFVSQSRSCIFTELVSSIVNHFSKVSEEKSGSTKHMEVYIWLDVFSGNQPQLCSVHPDPKVQAQRIQLLTTGLHEALTYFDGRLLFLDSFGDPTPIKRAWCVWEVYGITKNNLSLEIICSANKLLQVENNLISGGIDIERLLSQLNPKDMQCRNKDDLQMIRNSIESLDGGFDSLKLSVTDCFRLWFLNFAMVLRQKKSELPDLSAASKTLEAAKVLYFTGRILTTLREDLVATKYFESASQLFQKVNDKYYTAGCWHALGESYANLGQFQKSLSFLEQAVEYFEAESKKPGKLEEKSFKRDLATVYNGYAGALQRVNQFEKSLECYEKAHKLFVWVVGETSQLVATVHMNKGILLQSMKKYSDAQKSYMKSEKICLRLEGSELLLASVFYNRGMLYMEEKSFQKALEEYEKSLTIRRAALGELSLAMAECFMRIGTCYAEMNQTKNSVESFEKSVGILETLSIDLSSLANTYFLFANSLVKGNKPKDAEKYYKKCIEVCERMQPCTATFGDCLNNLGLLFQSQQKLDQAVACFEKALKVYKEVGADQETLKRTKKNLDACIAAKKAF